MKPIFKGNRATRGKHKGQLLATIPSIYLYYLLNHAKSPKDQEKAIQELLSRNINSTKYISHPYN